MHRAVAMVHVTLKRRGRLCGTPAQFSPFITPGRSRARNFSYQPEFRLFSIGLPLFSSAE
jgi:hypothetical protein